MSRYRLIPSRKGVSRFVEGTRDDALAAGKHMAASVGCKVLVCEAPEGGIVRQLGLVGPGRTPKRRMR